MDISNLTYEELNTLEDKIKERKIELERTQCKNLMNDVFNAINAMIEAGYGHVVACYDDEGGPYTWEDILYEIQHEYKRKKEDY